MENKQPELKPLPSKEDRLKVIREIRGFAKHIAIASIIVMIASIGYSWKTYESVTHIFDIITGCMITIIISAALYLLSEIADALVSKST